MIAKRDLILRGSCFCEKYIINHLVRKLQHLFPVDVDECKPGMNQCSHTCKNVNAGHVCLCPAGLIIGKDHRTCEGEKFSSFVSTSALAVLCLLLL